VELHKKVIEDSLESADADPNDRIPELQLSITELKAQIADQQRFVGRNIIKYIPKSKTDIPPPPLD